MLREAGHGAKRSLLCGLCLTEWPSMRLVCAGCSESQFEKLPVFRADEYDAVRVDACESCRTYIKTIDLTGMGAAVPVVDDLQAYRSISGPANTGICARGRTCCGFRHLRHARSRATSGIRGCGVRFGRAFRSRETRPAPPLFTRQY